MAFLFAAWMLFTPVVAVDTFQHVAQLERGAGASARAVPAELVKAVLGALNFLLFLALAHGLGHQQQQGAEGGPNSSAKGGATQQPKASLESDWASSGIEAAGKTGRAPGADCIRVVRRGSNEVERLLLSYDCF
mmetsp:Transcript_1716/g.5274  ORF Transcript_1716/g.5274 Transcript_1716/m.5274 type:complete len:134 (+) Transcript_1716:79-480(+)